LGASFYHTGLQDKVGLVDASDDAASRGYTYEWENIDDAYVRGFEVYAGWRPALWLDMDVSATFNGGEYDNVRDDWVGTPYESDSKYISRFPRYTVGLDFTVSDRGWSLVSGTYLTGPMYIDYYADGEGPTTIKETDPFWILNAKLSKRVFGGVSLYVGGRNLTDYVQPEKHTDDAAFLYAPVYGRMLYVGMGI
jgi:outer membrane receptor for ferrienterochelin and colicins